MRIRPIHILLFCLLLLITAELAYTCIMPVGEGSAYLMGTPVRVKVLGVNSPELAQLGLERISQLDALFSRFRTNSEVDLINRFAGQVPVAVSPDTYACIRQAAAVNQLTNGAFDITLGKPWALELDDKSQKVFLRDKEAGLDLGGIGKGFAAEAARCLLLKSGAKSGMIDMRSTIAVFGPRTWSVGIQHPRQKGKMLGSVTLMNGQSLATSGDYERGRHIIDPLTKQAADLCQSVTVIGGNAAETDALATAICVMGPEQGLQLIEALPNKEVLIIDEQGSMTWSSGFVLEQI
ncbi:MAG: FAD:protein FMN transferase [Candidatus Saganbacteria bacterium]|nr:FAD:protein FMN transferase [Candidatus Saganbacteria bacterium]